MLTLMKFLPQHFIMVVVGVLAFVDFTLEAMESAAHYKPQFAESNPVDQEKIPYRFGVFPLHNPVRLFAVYLPLTDSINEKMSDKKVRLEASRNYSSYEEKLLRGELDFAIINPYQALMAEKKGYRIFAKMGGDDQFRGIMVVRRDSGIKEVAALRGQPISFPAPTAMAATIMNKVYLRRLGLDVEKETIISFVNSQDSSVMNVFLGLTKAGGTWPPTWNALKKEQPEITAALEVKWQTESLPNLAVVAKRNVPDDVVLLVKEALLQLNESENGQRILDEIGIPKFEHATVTQYQPVKDFLAEYKRLFGELGPAL